MGHKGNGGNFGASYPGPDRVQVAQAMEIADLKATILGMGQKLEQMDRREKLLIGVIQRFRIVVIDIAGDRDHVDLDKPIHTVSREHIAEIDKQSIRCDVLPTEDFTGVECFVWTTEAGDKAHEERTKARARRKVPDEPLEVVKRIVTPH